MNYGIVGIEVVSAVESLKMDTTRDGQKCQYYRGFRLIEVLQNFHGTAYVTPKVRYHFMQITIKPVQSRHLREKNCPL